VRVPWQALPCLNGGGSPAMSDDTKPLTFQLLQGGSVAPSSSRDIELKVVPRRELPQVQLGFPFVRVSNKMLISVGYDGLTQAVLEKLLAEYMPSSIVGIRVSPSFNNYSLIRESVSRALKTFRVKYFHFPEFANRFVETLSASASRSRNTRLRSRVIQILLASMN
jgi:hypothetical protein